MEIAISWLDEANKIMLWRQVGLYAAEDYLATVQAFVEDNPPVHYMIWDIYNVILTPNVETAEAHDDISRQADAILRDYMSRSDFRWLIILIEDNHPGRKMMRDTLGIEKAEGKVQFALALDDALERIAIDIEAQSQQSTY